MIDIFFLCAMFLFLAAALFCLFMLWRNEWVCSQRMQVAAGSGGEYRKLPSYETMLLKFWIWDIEKFKEKK